MNLYDFVVLGVLTVLGAYVAINFRKILVQERKEKTRTNQEPELLLDNGGSIEKVEEVKESKSAKLKSASKKTSVKKTAKKSKKNSRREL